MLEYVPGGELFSYLREQGRLKDEDAKFYAAQVALAFVYLHSKSIAYRDLKPENLLIATSGNIKMADFGFAKIVDQRTWTLCGTPEYLAPETIQSRGHGVAVDWWALGILVYEMLVGNPPFYDENPYVVYKLILRGRVSYPGFLDSKATAFMKGLLTEDLTKRIGCLKNGVHDILEAKWFAKVVWKDVYDGTLDPPFKPSMQSEGDTSNFDEYPESDELQGEIEIPKDLQDAFIEFDSIGFTKTEAKDSISVGSGRRLAASFKQLKKV